MAATAVVNADLSRERENATFDVDQLTYFLHDGPEQTRRKRYLQNIVAQEFAKHKFRPISMLSREDQYAQSLKRFAVASQLADRLGLTSETDLMHFNLVVSPQTPMPYFLHTTMFTNMIRSQATEQQKQRWLPLAKAFRIIGTYAQTEIGHGTFLRGLETTATYDPKTQEFVLHSPTVSATKYWPGGLGKTCNCCILMAHLVTKGHNYGMHPFLVQIRDLDTHLPLPGITVGDIGTKFGFNSTDNGFLRLNQVRIPRTNMLMRHSQVLEDGTYMKPQNPRLVYGAMTMVRVSLVSGTAYSLALSVTIAVRYSAVRRQSEIEPGAREVQVLDYQSQQMKLLPCVATAYALKMTAQNMTRFHRMVVQRMETGAMDELPQLHALSSGQKALCTLEGVEGVEVCRRSCGGHGYSQASGIPKIYTMLVPYVTLEGENTVLMLQTARYLTKAWRSVQRGEGVSSLVTYLSRAPGLTSTLDSRLDLADLVDVFEHRAARLVGVATERLDGAVRQGQQASRAWNRTSVELVHAATAHCKAYIVKSFVQTVSAMTGRLRDVMMQLCQLYAATGILNSLGDFLEDGYISSQQSSMLRGRVLDLLSDLRPNAVALVDAFDFPDVILDSALGRWDGQAYQALYDWAQDSPMNEAQVLDAYYKYQRPFMESQWAKNPEVKAISRL